MIYKISKNKTRDLIDFYNVQILSFDFNSITDDLLTGKLGVIIYLLSLYELTNDPVYVDKIAELLELIFDNCNNHI
jgi:lantibiotic modifying enzyme